MPFDVGIVPCRLYGVRIMKYTKTIGMARTSKPNGNSGMGLERVQFRSAALPVEGTSALPKVVAVVVVQKPFTSVEVSAGHPFAESSVLATTSWMLDPVPPWSCR